MSTTQSRLELWDYVTFIILIIIASCIGVYHVFSARKSKNAGEFLVKSHDLGIVPLVLSTAATFTSAIGLLGFPVETYNNGFSFMAVCLSLFLLIPFGIYLILPIVYNLGINSIFQYLELRFNRTVRLSASAIMSLQMVLYTSCVMYAPALALNQVTGMHLWASVASIGVICIIYTSMGGIKAVVWADVTQIVVMIVVLIMILFKGTANLGGISEVWKICSEGKRTQFFIFTSSEYSMYSFWSMAIGGTFHYLGTLAVNQALMQRYICNPTLKSAKISFIASAVTISFLMIVTSIGGLLMYARYHDCDPLINGQVTSRDQIMALFAMETLGFVSGMPGVFVAAILCATLSTLSSCLNSLSAITMEDYIKPWKPKLKDSVQMLLSKIIAMVYGIICIIFVLFAQNIDGLIRYVFTINGVTGGPVLALFVMGMTLPWVNSWGAMSGFFAGLIVTGWASFGNLILNPPMPHAPFSTSGCNVSTEMSFYNQSVFNNATELASSTPSAQMAENEVFALYTMPSIWYASWSCGIGCVVALIVSLITGPQKQEELDPNLILPIMKRICSHLPRSYQDFLGFKAEKSRPTYVQIAVKDPDSCLNKEMSQITLVTELNSGMQGAQILNDSSTDEKNRSKTDF